jgi:hypothetical protein
MRMRTVAALLVALAGCGGPAIDDQPRAPVARFHDLSGPWRPQPFEVALDVLAAAEQTCRATPEVHVPAAARLGLVDARGGGRVDLVFIADNAVAQCQLDVRGDRFQFAGAGTANEVGAVDPSQLFPVSFGSTSGGGPGEDSAEVLGRAGENIREVRIAMQAGGQVLASLGRGWFHAWWPGSSLQVVMRGYDAAGGVVAEAQP